MTTPIGSSWNEFKGFVATYQLTIDYAPVGSDYFLFAGDGSLFIDAFITDAMDVLDFETNYKAFASEVSIPPSGAGPATLVSQATTPWVVSLATGAATSALQTTGNTLLTSIDAKTPSPGQALMAASSPVVIASDQASIPVSVGAIALPTGASTSALQVLGNASLANIDSKIPTVGQKLSALSSPVVLASDQSPILVSQNGPWLISALQSGLWSVGISGSLPLPLGAATEVTLATRASESTLAAINTKIPVLGQALMAASQPVVIASDQSPFSVSIGTSTGKSIIGKTGTLVTIATTADQVILTYTVTLGKTFYLEGFDWAVGKTALDHADGDYGLVSLENPLGLKLQTWFARGAGTDSFSRSLPEPLPIPSGTVIRLVVTPSVATSLTWVANLIGYEK